MYVYKNAYFGTVIISDSIPAQFTGVRLNNNVYIQSAYLKEGQPKVVGFLTNNKPIGYHDTLDKQAKLAWNENIGYNMKISNIEVYSRGTPIMSIACRDFPYNQAKMRIAMVLARTVTRNTIRIIPISSVLRCLVSDMQDEKLMRSLDNERSFDTSFIVGAFSLNNDYTMDYVCSSNRKMIEFTRFGLVKYSNVIPINVDYKFEGYMRNKMSDYSFRLCLLKRKQDEIRKLIHKFEYGVSYVTSFVRYEQENQQNIIFYASIINAIRNKLVTML